MTNRIILQAVTFVCISSFATAHSFNDCVAAGVDSCDWNQTGQDTIKCIESEITYCTTHQHASGGFAPLDLDLSSDQQSIFDALTKELLELADEQEELTKRRIEIMREIRSFEAEHERDDDY